MLKGYKTYLVSIGMVLVTGLYGMHFIGQGAYEILMGLLAGGGLAALRAGVSKIER